MNYEFFQAISLAVGWSVIILAIRNLATSVDIHYARDQHAIRPTSENFRALARALMWIAIGTLIPIAWSVFGSRIVG